MLPRFFEHCSSKAGTRKSLVKPTGPTIVTRPIYAEPRLESNLWGLTRCWKSRVQRCGTFVALTDAWEQEGWMERYVEDMRQRYGPDEGPSLDSASKRAA